MAFSAGHPQSLDFIALLAMVCASSLQFLPEGQLEVRTIATEEMTVPLTNVIADERIG